MYNISLSRTVFEIFDFKVFRVWPWPLTPKGHLGKGQGQTQKTLKSNISKTVRDREILSWEVNRKSMDNISLSRTIFEIFDFNVFRSWPWPLTPIGHLGSKISIPFESPYMTSYLTSMDNISLSRTVFEIFDFKVFRVWPWPLTPKGHLGSNFFLYHLKAHIWLPIWLLWTIFLYLVPFSRYSTSKFLGFDLDFWPLKVIWGQKNSFHSKAYIWLPSWLLCTIFLYLVLFSIHSTSKFLGFDLDLWPLKVIWGKVKVKP